MINIYGAGISGLTIAHILIKNNFKVTVYEKNNIAGGMARSVRLSNQVPTEHSWRGYGPFYYNLFKIIKEIPLEKNIERFTSNTLFSINEIKKHNTESDLWCHYEGNVYNLTKYILNHPGGNVILRAGGKDLKSIWEYNGVEWHLKNKNVMSILNKYKIGRVKESFTNNKTVYDNLSKKKLKFKLLFNKVKLETGINFIDYPYLVYLFLKVWTSNNRRSKYFKVKLDKLLKKNVSKKTYHMLVDFLAGPGYGFDKNTMSLGHYATFLEFNYFNKEPLWTVMNQPTSEAWIDPWVKYLKSLGVVFKFNSRVTKIVSDRNTIKYFLINNKTKVYADNHIICLDPSSMIKLFKTDKMNKNSNQIYKNLKQMDVVNNQISFRLGINKKIKFEKDNMGFVLVDSPYNITFYPQEDHWKKTNLGLDGKIKSLWSGTIIISYNEGSKYKKTATSLNIEQLKEEVIHQFLESNQLINDIKKYNNGYLLKKEDIIFSEIFEDWYYDSKSKRLKTKNKKWVNNFINEEFRPNNKTNFNNLYLAGSHTKTSINIWSMESAVESGIKSANLILKKNNQQLYQIYIHKSQKIFESLKSLDDMLYSMYLPNIIDVILIIIVIYFISKK